MLVRSWTETDIPILDKMEQRCFSDPWSKEDLHNVLKYPIYQSFLAEDEGQVCGYGCLIQLFETAEVGNIAVDIPFRNKGIGALLLNAMHKKAKELGATECLLEVRVSNAPAIRLYEKYGYERYGMRAKYYADGEDAVLMRKSL